MQNLYTQASLSDTYDNVVSMLEENKPELIQMLEDHIDFELNLLFFFEIAYSTREIP